MEKLLQEILIALKEMQNDSNAKSKQKLTYTLEECAQISGIGRNTLLEETYKADSTFPYFKVGRKIQVDKAMFEKWIKEMAENHTELRGEQLKCVR